MTDLDPLAIMRLSRKQMDQTGMMSARAEAAECVFQALESMIAYAHRLERNGVAQGVVTRLRRENGVEAIMERQDKGVTT